MKTYKVTFIIAHRNYQQYLGNAIKSARNQTYPCSICVIDDSSEDISKTIQIIAKELFDGKEVDNIIEGNKITYSNTEHTFIILKNGPYRQAYARNRGIEATWDNTDVFAILDADDQNHPKKVEKLLNIMMQYPHVGVVYGDYDTINIENGVITREFKKPFDAYELQRECIVHSGALIKKEAIESVLEDGKFYDEELSPVEDFHAWLKISKKWMILHHPESLSLVTVHPFNSTNTSTHEFRMNQLRKMYSKLGYS
jgi:glycosyltransferase involved in cell wall biosynthesis